ncbi:MAG: type I-E CRISPR-associated protein Cas7/Cse4/CasC [Bacteroidota bacterium]
MLVELHLLTSHAPSNLNRDDFGRPKTALFGGTERGRVSSQALKRAIRKSGWLEERFADKISTRSLHIPQMLHDEFAPQYEGDDLDRLMELCGAVTHALGDPDAKYAKKHDQPTSLKTSQIVFLTPKEIEGLRNLIAAKMEDGTRLTKKEVKAFGDTVSEAVGLDKRPTDAIDMGLFGRMTTAKTSSFVAVDASMQVAHPIATHTTVTETDYFTAVDDWKEEQKKATGRSDESEDRGDVDSRGSGHIGELDFNSAVYYKYLSCDLDALVRNLGGDKDPEGAKAAALDALEAVFGAACVVTPTGKQNSFASHSPADAALLVVREAKVPCSLATAFERAVPATSDGYTAASTDAMLDRYDRIRRGYELDTDKAAFFTLLDGAAIPHGVETVDRIGGLWEEMRAYVA